MMKAFMSYSRSDASLMSVVAKDIQEMGHDVWYDREVKGGQAWWNSILRQIRECDLFIFIMTPMALDSKGCRAEYIYAYQLQKRILPVLCHEGVNIKLLPPELSVIQFVDYCAQDKQALFALMSALQNLPDAHPLSDPLPPEPPVPISYLGDLRTQIEYNKELTLTKQRELLFEVKRRLKDLESEEDAFKLLRLLRDREDLFAIIAEEIDAILDSSSLPRPPLQPPGDQVLVDLTGDRKQLEALIRKVAATSENWVLEVDNNHVGIYIENGELVLVASFPRWGGKDFKRLKEKGWEPASMIKQGLAAGGLTVLGLSTYGIGFGLLLHKRTRDYINRKLMVKKFLLSQEREAAVKITEAFQILCPGKTVVKATKEEAVEKYKKKLG